VQRRQWIAILALPVLVLMMLGIYQAAAKTGTIRWSVLSHTLTGLVRVLS
jgi:hypothetical protein